MRYTYAESSHPVRYSIGETVFDTILGLPDREIYRTLNDYLNVFFSHLHQGSDRPANYERMPELRVFLNSYGFTDYQIDCLIAKFAIDCGEDVVNSDEEYEPLEELSHKSYLNSHFQLTPEWTRKHRNDVIEL